MSCEFYRQTPHHPRCPDAPPLKPVFCRVCGRLFEDPEDLICGICDKCLADSYIPERGKAYAAEDKAAFIKAVYGVSLDGTESEAQRARVLDIFFDRYFAEDYQEDPDFLWDYCFREKEYWASWLRETMHI